MSARQLRFVRIGIGLLAGVSIAWAGASTALGAPFVYVANSGTDNVTPLSASESGLLTAGPAIAVGDGPLGTAGTPNGRFLYVALNDADKVAAFAVAPDGDLTAVVGSPFATGINPAVPAVSPDGTHLYVANFGSDTISVYTIAADGSLAAVGVPAATGDGPAQVSISADGTHLYAPNFGTNSVSAFSIGTDGALAAVPGSPFAAGLFPNNSELSPDGQHLYVSNRMSNDISGYSVAANGALAAIAGSPFAAATNPNGIAIANDGQHLYAADTGSNIVSRYSIAANGALVSLGFGTTTGVGPVAVETNLDGDVLYVVNGVSSSVSSFDVEADGGLLPVLDSPFGTGGTSPVGRSVAVVDTDDRVAFSVESKRKQKQRGKRITVRFEVTAGEALTARTTGVIAGRGLRTGANLKRVSRPIAAGQSKSFTMKLKKKKMGKTVAKLLKKKKKLKANLTVTATDEVGNTNGKRVKIRLK